MIKAYQKGGGNFSEFHKQIDASLSLWKSQLRLREARPFSRMPVISQGIDFIRQRTPQLCPFLVSLLEVRGLGSATPVFLNTFSPRFAQALPPGVGRGLTTRMVKVCQGKGSMKTIFNNTHYIQGISRGLLKGKGWVNSEPPTKFGKPWVDPHFLLHHFYSFFIFISRTWPSIPETVAGRWSLHPLREDLHCTGCAGRKLLVLIWVWIKHVKFWGLLLIHVWDLWNHPMVDPDSQIGLRKATRIYVLQLSMSPKQNLAFVESLSTNTWHNALKLLESKHLLVKFFLGVKLVKSFWKQTIPGIAWVLIFSPSNIDNQ